MKTLTFQKRKNAKRKGRKNEKNNNKKLLN